GRNPLGHLVQSPSVFVHQKHKQSTPDRWPPSLNLNNNNNNSNNKGCKRRRDPLVHLVQPLSVDENGKIIDARFKTFGCGSAIASSSLATEWVKGKTVDEALKIRNTDIAKELCLPPVKLHCSMLAEDAIKAALADYKLKQGPKGPEPKQNAANA
uniref:Iron-sulfur cluster assembly enzyme n=1 Tax=Anolis carolinensis TaxID=28377 RepID=A0A803TAU1_ANOCA